VEALDKIFETVCELDLIFNVDKAHHILNEIIMGGMVLETNLVEILERVEEQSKLEKKLVGGNDYDYSFYSFSAKQTSDNLYVEGFY